MIQPNLSKVVRELPPAVEVLVSRRTAKCLFHIRELEGGCHLVSDFSYPCRSYSTLDKFSGILSGDCLIDYQMHLRCLTVTSIAIPFEGPVVSEQALLAIFCEYCSFIDRQEYSKFIARMNEKYKTLMMLDKNDEGFRLFSLSDALPVLFCFTKHN